MYPQYILCHLHTEPNARTKNIGSTVIITVIVAGINKNTVSKLIPIPLANALPKSGPIPNRINKSARKPITVVNPLDKIDDADLQSG